MPDWTPHAVEVTSRAEDDLAALDGPVRKRVLRAIDRYAKTGRGDVKALQGQPGFRLRVGDWRVVFLRRADKLVVLVVQIAHRREAYR